MAAASVGASGDRASMDEAITEQLENIEKQVAEEQPLADVKKPLSVIVGEYNTPGSETFREKAEELSQRYSCIRKIRGDGNCFYRALIFAQSELMVADRKEYQRFKDASGSWKERLFKLGFPQFTTEDFCDFFAQFLEDLLGMTETEIFTILNDDGKSNYILAFLKLVTSGYLQENADFYQNFVSGERTLKEYCAQEVEPMWKLVDHVIIQAITKALGLNIRVEYLDRTSAPAGGWHHDFVEEGKEPQLFFLYRHDHYDVLYKT